jgi:hypothetical protein
MDITAFTPEQLRALKAQLDGLSDTTGRSPFRSRQLHDLRLLPTKDDPRPTFVWSAEPPRDAGDLTRTTPYPRLMWHLESGEEITVDSQASEQTMTAQGFILTAPADLPAPDPLDAMRVALEQLSPEDRALLLAAAQQDRKAALQAQLAALPESQLAALLAANGTAEPVRRGPGRPRKES